MDANFGNTREVGWHSLTGKILGRFLRMGYEDARRGLPFRQDYHAWPTDPQHNYERGRLIAVNIKAAGMSAPAWRKNVFRPDSVLRVSYLADDMVGCPHPGRG